MEEFAKAATREAIGWHIDIWIIRSNRPYLIVEDEYFIKLLHLFKSHVDIPSANTVSSDLKEIYKLMKARVVKLFAVSPATFSCVILFDIPSGT